MITETIKSPWLVRRGKIINAGRLTGKEILYEVKLEGGEDIGHEPGQFVQVSLFGAGEAPISICSSPSKKGGAFELCVREAGRVVKAVQRLKKGAEIGIRGPFGKGFPVQILMGKDLLFVAGGLGLAPLRSLINYVIDNRRDFGKVNILLGCKTPGDMLFRDEIKQWQKRVDVNFSCTVDRGSPDWAGNVGLITSLIPGVNLNPLGTFAVVVGPPVMYKFVVAELLKKGLPEKQIYLSLERHMKCGLRKCGHCQMENLYCCADGPVFSYDQVKHLGKL